MNLSYWISCFLLSFIFLISALSSDSFLLLPLPLSHTVFHCPYHLPLPLPYTFLLLSIAVCKISWCLRNPTQAAFMACLRLFPFAGLLASDSWKGDSHASWQNLPLIVTKVWFTSLRLILRKLLLVTPITIHRNSIKMVLK